MPEDSGAIPPNESAESGPAPPETAHWSDDPDSSLLRQVRAELRTYFEPPFEVPTAIAFNVCLVLGVWFFINPADVLRHTSLIFLPVAIVSWAFADVPATNHLGSAPDPSLRYLDEPARLRRIFTVKNIALWVLITPACVLLSLALIPAGGEPLISIAIAVAVIAFPFAYLGLAAMMAPLLPFHPMPWRTRLARRDTWLRYFLAIGVAYFVLTAPAAILVLAPAIIILGFVGRQPEHFFLAAVLITPWALIIWRVGLHLAAKIAIRRRVWLAEFLSDPSRG